MSAELALPSIVLTIMLTIMLTIVAQLVFLELGGQTETPDGLASSS